MGLHPRRIIVLGASTGGVEALQRIVRELPADLAATVLIVMHTSADSPGLLPAILGKVASLPVDHAVDGEELGVGRVYVAPPNHHLLVEPSGRARLSRGPKENHFRPAIDPLFRSTAYAFGPYVIGVVLTGALDDGTAGLWAIKRHGGIAVVQDPRDAFISSMPLSALHLVEVDHCLPVAEIGPLLCRLVAEPITSPLPRRDEMDVESKLLLGEPPEGEGWYLGSPSYYACPECHGALQHIEEGRLIRYRCHVGHGYSIESLLAELSRSVSEALWSAVRAIEESARLLLQQAEHAHVAQDPARHQLYLQRTNVARKNAEAIRVVAMRQEPLVAQRRTHDEEP